MGSATRFRLLLPRWCLDGMVAQARTEVPNECCGLLAGIITADGTEALVTHRYPLVNDLASPTEFTSEPRSMFRAMRDVRRWRTEVLAVYHSHPTSPPLPSRKDLERNYAESVMNVIVGLAGAEPDVRGWWLTRTAFEPGEWEIVAPE